MNVHFRLLKKISPFQNFEYPNLSRGPAPDYAQRDGRQDALRPRVNETGGNRSGLTGQTGPAQFRFGPVSNRPRFKIQIWIQKK